MSQTEPGPDSSSDAKMDAILKEFFAHEVPAELRQSADAPRLVSVRSAAHKQHQRQSGWLGLSVVAGSLLTVAILLSQPSPQSPIDPSPEESVASSPELRPEADGIVAVESASADASCLARCG